MAHMRWSISAAMELLSDGDQVTIDGSRGVVWVC
jgi:phosphohistidine swiveling domain-containing protein